MIELQKNRIAIFVPSMRGGGAERVMLTLANSFSERGFAVDLVLAKAEGPYVRNVSDAVRVIDLDASRVMFCLFKLAKYLKREQPVSLLSAMSHANVLAVWAHALSRIDTKIIVSERNTVSTAFRYNRNMRKSLLLHLMRLSYTKVQAVTSVSKGVADDLSEIIGLKRDKISVIYNPVVSQELLIKAKEPISHPWLLPDNPPVILSAGRLTIQKDFKLLIRAFAQVRAHRLSRLVILGEGELRENLQALADELRVADDFLLPGFVENPFMWMRHASVFVVSSIWEGLPGALIQAMACGTPVVSTDCPSGPAEILEKGRWGRLVSVGDEKSLAKAIEETLNDPNPPDVTKRAADFSVDKAVDEYLRVLGFPCFGVSHG